MTRQTYQIVAVTPVYHFSTDALIGERECWRSQPYLTVALAHKLADRMWTKDYQECGDDSFYVVPTGGSPFRDRIYQAQLTENTDSDIPF